MIYYHLSSQLSTGDKVIPSQKKFNGWSRYAETTVIKNENDFRKEFDFLMASKVEQETGRKPHKWLCETVFENIRKKHFADCPSRIYGIYLCETLGDAISFRNNIRKGIGSIFEVSIPDNVDYFDMNLFTQAETLLHGSVNDREMFQVCIGLANRYWAKKNDNLIVEKEYIYENIVLIGTKIM